MFKLTKTILNNLNKKSYLKNKDNLELYDSSGINRVPLKNYSYQMQRLDNLEINYRRSNLKIYMKNMAKLRAKQAIVIATPILLGGLTIASFVNGKYIKTETVEHVYHNTVQEFDEESKLENIDMYYTTFVVDRNYARDNVKNESIDTSSYALFYYGDGSDAIQVKFDINDDNTWQYNSHTNYLYDKYSNPPKWPVCELDEQYKKLINEATETFIRQADLSEEEIAYLRELVSNNENDIIFKIKKCELLSDVPLELNAFHWIRCALLIIVDIVLVILFIKYNANLTEPAHLYVDNKENSVLKEGLLRGQNLFNAALNYRSTFLLAENNRINNIHSLLAEHGGSDAILSKYEKRLVKQNKEKLEMND